MVWEFVFLMLILKIPVIYLCLVVYWAVRGDRGPAEPVRTLARPDVEPRPPWTRRTSGHCRRRRRLPGRDRDLRGVLLARLPARSRGHVRDHPRLYRGRHERTEPASRRHRGGDDR